MSEKSPEFSPEFQWAVDVVQDAARLAKRIESESGSLRHEKDDRTPVTAADFAVQALVAGRIQESFPGLPLVAEESKTELVKNDALLKRVANFLETKPERAAELVARGSGEPQGRFWTLDPVDGTKGFLRGDQYCVALALVEEGQVLIGVLGCPSLPFPALSGKKAGTVMAAETGKGAWQAPLTDPLDRLRISVSEIADPARARLLRSYESGHTDADRIEKLRNQFGSRTAPIQMDSQAKYAVLARGEGEILLRLLNPEDRDYKETIWDQAAGSLILAEAGGRVTDVRGKALDFSKGRRLTANQGVVASNGLLHEAVLNALRPL